MTAKIIYVLHWIEAKDTGVIITTALLISRRTRADLARKIAGRRYRES